MYCTPLHPRIWKRLLTENLQFNKIMYSSQFGWYAPGEVIAVKISEVDTITMYKNYDIRYICLQKNLRGCIQNSNVKLANHNGFSMIEKINVSLDVNKERKYTFQKLR